MNEIDKTNLSDQTKVRLKEIGNIENYFDSKINQRKSWNKKLSKYFTIFDYIDNVLIVLRAMSGGVCIFSSLNVIGTPVGIAGANFTLIFPLTTGKVKKSISITRNKRKKHDKILITAKSKFNSIETLASQELIDMEISHEEFVTILKEKDKYEKMKEHLRNVNEKQKIMRLSSTKSKIICQFIKILFYFFVCMYKIIKISKETYKNCEVELIDKERNFWVNRRDLDKIEEI